MQRRDFLSMTAAGLAASAFPTAAVAAAETSKGAAGAAGGGKPGKIDIGINLEFIRHEDKPFEWGVEKAAALGYE